MVDGTAADDDDLDAEDEHGQGGRGAEAGRRQGARGGAGSKVVLDQWQHAAHVLCNAARIPEGR